jgi:O-antigen/teichoic acid export membrane protein
MAAFRARSACCIGFHVVARRIAFGSTLLIAARFASRFIDVATMSILARNLRPSDFGLVAIAMTLVLIAEAMFEMPVNDVLVRQDSISAAQYDTAFTLGLLRGLVLSSLIILLAWPFAHFYADPRLVALLCVLSLAPFARGMRSPRLALFHKQMSFWRDMVIDTVGKCAGFGASVTICLLTHSYWSIVFGTVAYPLAMAVLSYILAPYRIRFSLSAMSSFSGILGWVSAAQIISAINWQSDRLLLAKVTATRELGMFTTASDLANIPIMALFVPVQRPLLSAFSHLQADPSRLIRGYKIATGAVVTIGLPMLVGICFMALPLVHLLLGSRWLDAAPLLQWLALGLVPVLVSVAIGPFVMAVGKTHIFARNNLIELGVKLPILIISVLRFGLYGAILTRFIDAVVVAICSLWTIRRLTGVPMVTHLLWFWRSAASTAFMALILLAYQGPINPHAALAHQLAAVVGTSLLGAFAYGAALFSFWVLSGSPDDGVEHLAAMELQKLLGKRRRALPG